LRHTGILIAACLYTPALALGQAYPAKPVKLVMPFAPGGSSDFIGRVIAEGAGEILGQSMVVDNRAGAGGTIGTAFGARAAPDGYTLTLCAFQSCTINPALLRNINYDPPKDFAAVIDVGDVMSVILVRDSLPVKSVKELVALAGTQPGKLSFSSGGVGGAPYMTLELLKYQAQINILHVAYKGAGSAIIDVMSGQIDMTAENEPAALSSLKSGKVRAIAITGARRSPRLPNLPTMVEQGYPDFVVDAWNGIVVPAGTPRPVVDRLNAAFNAALQNPRFTKRLEDAGVMIVGGTPDVLGERIKNEIDKWSKMIKAANIQAN
jgi:tripartite-type tricarboxylate transporter receptor subunit TctC